MVQEELWPGMEVAVREVHEGHEVRRAGVDGFSLDR